MNRFQYADEVNRYKYSGLSNVECLDILKCMEQYGYLPDNTDIILKKEQIYEECELIAYSRVFDIIGYEWWLEYPDNLYIKNVVTTVIPIYNILKHISPPYCFYKPIITGLMPVIMWRDTIFPNYN